MAALRCMLEKVGSRITTTIGFNNHGVRRTMLLGFFGAVNPVINNNNNHQHLLYPHSYSTMDFQQMRKKLRGFMDVQVQQNREPFDLRQYVVEIVNFNGGKKKWGGSLDHPFIKEAAITSVELHNKQQNTNLEFVRVVEAYVTPVSGHVYDITLEAIDNGVNKNTYQAQIWRHIGKHGASELQSFSLLAPVNQTNLIDKQAGTAATCDDASAQSSSSTTTTTTNTTPSLEGYTSCSIKNAMTVLRNLPDVKSCDDNFLCGSLLFLKYINREMFLKGLQTDQERLAWLQLHLPRDRGSQSKMI